MEKPRIVGGHVALDLVNTVAPRPADDAAIDWLDSPAALLHWSRRVDLINPPEAEIVSSAWSTAPASGDEARQAVAEIREALYTVVTASLTAREAVREGGSAAAAPDELAVAASLDRLMLRWSAATARSALRPGGPDEPPAVLEVGSPGALLIADRLAHAAVDLVRTADLTQLRACPVAEGGCGWLFLDRSRNHSRRWCTMDDCGTHAKSRRLTSRRRTARTAQR
jgi:predicted RNA-binding Zn ribbon-like protein